MRITVEVREEAFRKHKTATQIEDEVREGATMLWLARGDVGPGDAGSVVERVPHAEPDEAAPTPPPAQGEPTPREPMLYDLLILGPNVGEDSDFERRRHPPRELPEWDT
jgi:hypothetical protein